MPSEITTAADLAGYPLGTAARLRVVRGSTTEFPLAQRVRGGWQTGVHHYPDEQVACVLGIYRPDRPAQPTAQPTVEEVARAIYDCTDLNRAVLEDAREIAEAVLALIGGHTEQEVIDSFLTRLGEAVAQFSGDQRLTALAAAIRAGEQ